MSISTARFGARTASLCLAIAMTVIAPAATHAGTKEAATQPSARPSLVTFPPRETTKDPISVVYLHGITGRPEHGCPWFRPGASTLGWLVCPEANVRMQNGTASWGGDIAAQSAVVEHALDVARASGASAAPGVAIGFSQGGYVTMNLVQSHRARFRGLVLIAAPEMHPTAQMLHEAGVERVALAAGKYDMAHAPLVAAAKRLQAEGIATRFYDLGRVGHTYAAEDASVLYDAIAWAGGRE